MDTSNLAHSLEAVLRLIDLLEDEVDSLIVATVSALDTPADKLPGLVATETELDDHLDALRRVIAQRFPEVKASHVTYRFEQLTLT